MIRKLDHVNIVTTDLPATISFYSEILGLKPGPLPSLPGLPPSAAGAWIYDPTGAPVVHVQTIDPDHPEKSLARMRDRRGAMADGLSLDRLKGSAAVDHVAFECADFEGMRTKLKAAGCEIRTNEIPGTAFRQIFVNDPNGVTIELNFPGA